MRAGRGPRKASWVSCLPGTTGRPWLRGVPAHNASWGAARKTAGAILSLEADPIAEQPQVGEAPRQVLFDRFDFRSFAFKGLSGSRDGFAKQLFVAFPDDTQFA